VTPPSHPIKFPAHLPITARVQDIARAIDEHQVVIVAGETGSGKTTQLPKICLAMGRGLRGRIGCTQPRRIAATSVAARVAEEIGVELGCEIGYKIRFSDKTSGNTYVKFVTDGILLAELQSDPTLRGYDTVIVDEAHERNLNIDFLLGTLKLLLPRRPDLRVIVSSATLETDRFSSYFSHAPVVEVSGRTHPVELVAHPLDDSSDLPEGIGNVVEEITQLDPRGDILVFLPGEREIRETMDALAARALRHTVLMPLYGRMPQHEQLRVFKTLPQRRIVLATNVAETSLTIPGIVFVVDTGLARVNRYNPRTGITQLLVEPISRASADQRKGRAGRLHSGVCYRLYGNDDYQARVPFTIPEVQRVGLAGVILQMKTLGLGRIEDFPFLDMPSKKAVDEGYHVLEELGALDDNGDANEVGRKLAQLPLDPRLGAMVLAAQREGCLREVLVIAAALSIQDPRERPIAAQKKADESHRRFRDEASDFVGLLKLWDWYQASRTQLSTNQLRKLCRDTFVSAVRMREWSDIHDQLGERCRELDLRPTAAHASGEAIHRALLAGLLGRIGMWQPEKRSYIGARQIRFTLHPASALAKKPPSWVFAAEIVETSQTFARTASVLDPAWVESVAGALCKRSYHDPHWEQKPAQVIAKEQLTLFGLPVAKDRRVHYGPVAPALARQLFIVHALVRQELSSKAPFVDHNRRILEQAQRLRDRARRSDMLVDEDALLAFFDARIPDGVYSGKTFEDWRQEAERHDPSMLKLSLEDVLQEDANSLSPNQFPESLALYGTNLKLSYRFDPVEDDDGITVELPLTILTQADPELLEWTIPGWHAEKILLMLQSLTKSLRKAIAPIAELAQELSAAHAPFDGPMLQVLARDIHALTGVRIPPDAWRLDELPQHLRFYFRVVDDSGSVAGEGRDLAALQLRLGARAREVWSKSAKAAWEREGLTAWSFDAIPQRLSIRVAGGQAFAYPALVDAGDSVALRALPSEMAAQQATRQGLRRLFLLHLRETSARLERAIPGSLHVAAVASYVANSPKDLREQLVARALDESFGLTQPAYYPRTRNEFLDRLGRGKAQLQPQLSGLAGLVSETGAALSAVETTLRGMAGKPGAPRAALDDAKAQLDGLLTKRLFDETPVERLAHLPRYLRAIQVRLQRLPNDPRRDADKAAQVVPLWRSFLEHKEALRARGVPQDDLESFRWLVEELRVSVFAPELKTAVPVSPQRVAERWKSLAG
jgi:ATP-dependent helicase HrpA